MNKSKFILLCTFISLFSCKDGSFLEKDLSYENNQYLSSSVQTRSIETDDEMSLDEIRLAMSQFGLDTTGIYEWNEYFVVEGDILIPKNSQIYRPSYTRQEHAPIYVANELEISVGLCAEYQNDQSWVAALQESVSLYNENTDLYFTYSNNNPDILIMPDDLDDTTYGRSGLPTSANAPFNRVYINYDCSSYTVAKKVGILMHEIGHCIGLMHTEASFNSFHVPGTSYTDENSFMRSWASDPTWHGFSQGDLIMLRYLWPVVYCTLSFNNSLSSIIFSKKRGYELQRNIVPNSTSSRVFGGWYNDPNLNSRWQYGTVLHQDRVLYPRWLTRTTTKSLTVTSYAPNTSSFTVNDSQVVTYKIRVNKGLNSWSSISGYLNEIYGLSGKTVPLYRFDMMNEIFPSTTAPLYVEKSIPIFIDAGTYWNQAFFCASLGPQDTASGNHGSTELTIYYQ